MSYILDALKKLETDKEKKSRADGMINLSGALLRDEPRRRPSSGNAWKIGAGIAVASLAIFAVAWFVLHSGKKPAAGPASPPVRTPVAAPAPAVTAVPASPSRPIAPPASPTAPPEPRATTPVRQAAPPASPPAPAPVTAQKAGVAIAPVPAVSPAASEETEAGVTSTETLHKKKRKGMAAPAPQQSPAVRIQQPLSPPPADIKVSGIAWQDERSLRRAVVNGFLIHEGSVVSGATVTEILRDRVRFSSGDKVFEVPLVMTVAPSAAAK
ncbi:MAG TPA: hypothetical protein VF795_13105 [Desulfuromonadaceae bacterium]